MKKKFIRVLAFLTGVVIMLTSVGVVAIDNTMQTYEVIDIEDEEYASFVDNVLVEYLQMVSEEYYVWDVSLNDLDSAYYVGPFYVIDANDDGIRNSIYFLFAGEKAVGMVYFTEKNGKPYSSFQKGFINDVYTMINDGVGLGFVYFDGVVYSVDENYNSKAVTTRYPNIMTASTENTVNTEISVDIASDIDFSDVGIMFNTANIIEINPNHTEVNSLPNDINSVLRSAPPTPPLVPQNNTWCHNAVIASIVAARDSSYSGLTAAQVAQTTGFTSSISYSYGRARKITELIEDYFLPETGIHATTYLSNPINQTTFKNHIDNGRYVACVSLLEGGTTSNYHVVLMYDYNQYSGYIHARIMDPFNFSNGNAGYIYRSWYNTDSVFSFEALGDSSIVFYMDEVVINYS